MINLAGNYYTKEERECTNCGVIYPNPKKTVTLCPSCNSTRVKAESPQTRMYRRAKSRSVIKGQDFSITKEDIVIPEFCPILGIKLEVHSGKSGGRPNSPSLDRVDNSKGYVKGNVLVISHLANVMKASATEEQLVSFAEWVLKTYKPGRSSEAS